MEFGLLLAFMTGLLGAGHCLGMCGSFAGGYFIAHGGQHRIIPHFSYHSARISVYVLLGIVGALLGRVLVQTGSVGKAQGILMIVAGLLIIVLGAGLNGWLPWSRKNNCSAGGCEKRRLESLGSAKRIAPVTAGLLNGFVPCSLVFSVAIKATATADPFQSGLIMLSFGLGTLPMMLLVTIAGASFSTLAKGITERLAGWIVMLMGTWTLYQGLVFYDIMRGLAS